MKRIEKDSIEYEKSHKMYDQLFSNNQEEIRNEILKEQSENFKIKNNEKFVIKKAVDALLDYHERKQKEFDKISKKSSFRKKKSLNTKSGQTIYSPATQSQ